MSKSKKVEEELSSLRQQVEDLVGELSSLRKENDELRKQVLEIPALRLENKQLRQKVSDLEDKLRTNSHNSSKPPSQDPHRKRRKKRRNVISTNFTKKSEKESSSNKTGLNKPPQSVDQVVECLPADQCDNCRGHVAIDLEKTNYSHQYEMPPADLYISEFRVYWGACESCGKSHQGQWPEGLPTGKLGIGLIAQIASWTGDYKLSKREVQRMLEDQYDLHISISTISKAEAMMSEALKKPYDEAKEDAQSQPVVHGDETSHKMSGKKQWLWVMATTWISVFMIHANRSTAAAKLLLGEGFKGILISDRYNAYNWVNSKRRQLCWAHLIRDFVKWSQRSGDSQQIGDALLFQCKRMFEWWNRLKQGKINRQQFQIVMKPIRKKILELMQTATLSDDHKMAAMAKNMLKFKKALFTFVDIERIEPTNNFAELTIRPYVLWRKKSFGSRSERGNRYIERMCTTVASCRQQSRNVLDFLTSALQAHLLQTEAPSLLPQPRRNQIAEIA